MPDSGSILGNPVQRVEDPRLLRGEARYVDDLTPPQTVHVAFVRSSMAHARLGAVDTGDAERMPGVLLVATHDTLGLADVQGFIMLPPAFNRPPLANGVVRFVGDIVAVVVAETRTQAVDAAEAVIVEYEPLPVVVDPEAALADDAPLLFPEHGSNLAIAFDFGADPTIFDDADLVVEGRFVNQRLAAVPMEPNGVLVEPGADGGLTVTAPTQAPFGVRDPLAAALGLDPAQVRVVAPAVGGGFGAKSGAYCEYVIAAALAHRLERPVKWTESRSENMVAMTHGRAQVQYVELGLKRDGRIVGLRARIVADGGAYPLTGAFLPFLTRMMGQGVYDIPKVEINSRSAVTNTTPTGAYRGAGRPEATQMLERIIDIAAAALELDPVEMRRRNLLPPERFPLTTVTGANYDVGEYAKALDEALRVAGYDELRREQAARRARGDTVQLGIGVATYVEVTAGGLFQEFGAVEVHVDGTVTAAVGTSSHGQGHETTFAMIVAELLGVPMDAVRLVQSDTALVPRGSGTMGSRSVQIGGSALHQASEAVVFKAKQLAAHLLEADEADITFVDGSFAVAGVPATSMSWAELARASGDDTKRPPDMEPGLAVALDFNQGDATFPFGAHVAVVEVDLETGRVELLRHIAVDDCGRIINPLLVTGQQHGGIAQGVAQALFEGVAYDEDGNPLTTTLIDYAIPSAAELPNFEASNTVTPTPLNPLGAKGIGESGTIGSTPAVHNAVVDAVSHLGIRHIDMPLTPERVWRALQDGAVEGEDRDA
ncbi:MAG: aerobic carbon-monoxide dehydrogenase large subunit [Actinomycetota bacterium]|jgi:carbon-monoxide dehydrogenase large subunit|nr:aerobic carbon-monoxide dehydrogenase large subunit [Actinomycetota bacterium]